ncbi:MAG: hypothetical protein VYA84_17300 [Planctomycetota bacterium]|nr:hypothetical protein [Planctomycetota bacterium]
MNPEELETFRPLLMGLLDDELSTDEVLRVNEALRRSATLREEYEQLCADAGKLETLAFLETPEAISRKLWKSPYRRFVRNSGVLAILGGYCVLILYAIYQTFAEDGFNVPGLALAAIVFGAFVLLISFVRERLETSKTDPYKEIER